jgi:hypothetical protein
VQVNGEVAGQDQGAGVVVAEHSARAEGFHVFRTAVLVAISCCVLPVQVLVVDLSWGLVAES